MKIMSSSCVAKKMSNISNTILPHLARLCLVSSFIDASVSLWFQWEDQKEYLVISWGCTTNIATSFLIFNLVGQLGSVTMILTRFFVRSACLIVICTVIFQAIAFKELLKLQFLFRNVSLLGSLLLVVADTLLEEKSHYAGLPSLGQNKTKKYLLLVGRILTLCMFEMVLSFDMSTNQIIQNIAGSLLMVLFTVGYKTRLSALVMVIWLTSLNITFNAWWKIPYDNQVRLLIQYEFFQRVSVIGGLLMLISLGAGDVSIDAQKKKW
jgi:uncharacterized membrane protein YphA (DoxX/SURF4 family)